MSNVDTTDRQQLPDDDDDEDDVLCPRSMTMSPLSLCVCLSRVVHVAISGTFTRCTGVDRTAPRIGRAVPQDNRGTCLCTRIVRLPHLYSIPLSLLSLSLSPLSCHLVLLFLAVLSIV